MISAFTEKIIQVIRVILVPIVLGTLIVLYCIRAMVRRTHSGR